MLLRCERDYRFLKSDRLCYGVTVLTINRTKISSVVWPRNVTVYYIDS